MIPQLFVDDEEVLPVRLRYVNFAHVAEIRDGSFRRISRREGQKQNK
jgi:hypothetical protein